MAYGHIAFGYKSAGKLYYKELFSLINDNARMDENATAYVEITFVENRIDQDEYVMTRHWSWNNTNIIESVSVIKNNISFDEEALADFQNYLLHLIPPDLLNLYFFDGEKIAEFFLGEQHNNLKEALLTLSGNDTYEILYQDVSVRNLQDTLRKYGSKSLKNSIKDRAYCELIEKLGTTEDGLAGALLKYDQVTIDKSKKLCYNFCVEEGIYSFKVVE